MELSIAFIVIGKNEGIKIKKCLASVFATIEKNALEKAEVIYVDSDSKDDSISYALEFEKVTVIKISGQINAAVARNEGAKAVDKKILFFIDGDMEINPDFLPLVFNNTSMLVHAFVSGDFISIDKTSAFNVSQIKYHNLKQDTLMSTTGGIFITYKEIWNKVGGMKNKFRRSQDIDFGLRMTKKGYKLLRKKDIIAFHNTVFYHSKKRLWKDLFNGNQMYQKSVLYRDHILNPNVYGFILRELTLLTLILAIILISITGNAWFALIFFVSILIKVLYKRKSLVDPTSYISSALYYTVLDVFILYGLFFFWPSNRKKYQVEIVRNVQDTFKNI